jgi:hypothetical protein
MCFSAKLSITTWYILSVLALFLWYRNDIYDRSLAGLILSFAIVQLIEYGIFSGANAEQSTKAIFIVLWLQCLILSIGSFLYIGDPSKDEILSIKDSTISTIAKWNMFFYAFIFMVALIYTFTSDTDFSLSTDRTGLISYYRDGDPLLNNLNWLYLAGIFIPLFLIFFKDAITILSMGAIILAGVFIGLYILANYERPFRISIWCYMSSILAFVIWSVGLFPAKINYV